MNRDTWLLNSREVLLVGLGGIMGATSGIGTVQETIVLLIALRLVERAVRFCLNKSIIP